MVKNNRKNKSRERIEDTKKKKSAIKWKRRFRRTAVTLVLLLCLLFSIFVFLQSDTFEGWFRNYLVTKLSDITGRTIRVDKINVDLFNLALHIQDFEIGGKEGEDTPFLRVESIHASLDFFAIFDREFKFTSVNCEKPELYLRMDSNGRLNIPPLKAGSEDSDPFFRFVVENLRLESGLFRFNSQLLPIAGNIKDFSTAVKYDSKNDSYEGYIRFSEGSASIAKYHNLNASMDSSFIFLPDRFIFPEIHLSFSGIDVTSSGLMYDFQNTRYTFNYKGTSDLAIFSEIFKLPIDLKGIAELQGIIKSTAEGFNADGTLKSGKTTIGPFQAASISAHFYFTPDRIQFTEIDSEVFDGSINGTFVVETEGERTDYWLQFDGENLETEQIISGIGFGGLNFASRNNLKCKFEWTNQRPDSLTGELDLYLRKSRDMEKRYTDFIDNLDNSCGYRPVSGDAALTEPIPISGDIHLIVRKGDWKLQTSRVLFPKTRFVVYGKGRLLDVIENEIKVESHEIKEIDLLVLRLVRVLKGLHSEDNYVPSGVMPPPYVGLRGSGQFRGRFVRKGDEPFYIYGNAFGRRIWAHNNYWDEGGARLFFQRDHLSFTNGWNRKGNSSGKFSGEVHLFGDASPGTKLFSLDLTMNDFLCQDVQDLFFFEKNLFGFVTGDLKVRINHKEELDGGLDIVIREGRLFDDEFDRATVKLQFDNDWLNFERLYLVKGEQEVNTELNLNLEDAQYKVKGVIKNVKVENIKSLYLHRSPVKGSLDLAIEGEGFTYAPAIQISGKVREMRFLEKPLGDVDLNINGEDGVLNLNALFSEDNTLLTGQGKLSKDYSFTATANVLDANLYKFIPYTGGIVDDVFGGMFSGEGTITGSLMDIGDVRVEGSLKDFKAKVNNYIIGIREPVKFSIHDFVVSFDPFHLRSDNSDIQIEGSIGLSRLVPSNLKLCINLGLNDLMAVFSDLSLEGTAGGEGYLRGFILDPYWGGKLEIENGNINTSYFPAPLEEISGKVEFTQSNISLGNITGKISNGDVSLDGQVTFRNSEPDRLLLLLKAENVSLEYPEGVEFTLGGSLNISGDWHDKELTGNVQLAKLRYTRRFDLEEALGGFAEASSRGAGRTISGFLETIDFNVNIQADDDILIDNNIAQAEFAANIRLTGTLSDPVILGRIEAIGGLIYYRDRTFHILSASLDNFDPYEMNPLIDFRARTKVKNYNIYLSVHGTMDKIYPSLSSEPSLPTIDIINLLALGKARSSIWQHSEDTLLGVGISSLLAKPLVGGIEEGAEKLFGFDRFRIDPFLVGSKSNPTARLTIGKRITKDLSLVYSTNITQTQEDVLILEYRLSDRILLIASRNEYGAYGVDVQFEHKF